MRRGYYMCKLTADEKKDIENGIPMTVISIDSKGDIKESESFNLENVHISDLNMRLLARTIILKVREFYSDPENVKRYEAWKASQK